MNIKQAEYKVNEIFYSIQGEGYHTGKPSVFIRFSGCNLNCNFCDTDHEHYEMLTTQEIIKQINKYPCSNVLITGGEPTFRENLEELLSTLKQHAYWVAVETNGTGFIPAYVDWICISPKTKNFCGQGNELKIIFDNHTEKELRAFLKLDFEHFYLQPKSGENINEVIEVVKSMPSWNLSVQMHKLVGIK